VGARPQFIKAATVSRVIAKRSDIEEQVVHTGQHFDSNMSDVFFEELDIPKPAYHLGIHGGHHGAMTGQMLIKIEEVLLKEMPDWVLVYGDTNSTLAGALAAAKLNIPLAHVEAGLRSFNRKMPEEINRIMTDHLSDCLFAPTEIAVKNLNAEGLPPEKIYKTGDVMLDAMLFYVNKAEFSSNIIDSLNLVPGEYLLATVHRSENTDDPSRLIHLVECLNFASNFLPVILPLHPRTRNSIAKLDSSYQFAPNIHVIEPIGYLDMVKLEKHARLILTDSGGVQKEAYFHKVPCITLRAETEWIELVEKGWNRLVGVDFELFKNAISSALVDPLPHWFPELYGKGNSAQEIVDKISL
jgi:UDP-GlcNAc3NAcA epimerase